VVPAWLSSLTKQPKQTHCTAYGSSPLAQGKGWMRQWFGFLHALRALTRLLRLRASRLLRGLTRLVRLRASRLLRGFRLDTHRYEFRCHYLPHFISNLDTNTDIIEYEWKTDISNSDSHSNTYSIYSWDSYVDGFIIDQIMLLHWIRKSWNPNYSYSYPLKMLIWISIFVFFFNIDVRWMYSNPFFNIILFNIIRIIRQKSDISDIIRIRIK
jgi:hypothetical protein